MGTSGSGMMVHQPTMQSHRELAARAIMQAGIGHTRYQGESPGELITKIAQGTLEFLFRGITDEHHALMKVLRSNDMCVSYPFPSV